MTDEPLAMVVVRWVDSMLLDDGSWMDRDEVEDALEPGALDHETVGFLVGENERAVAIASGRNAAPDDANNSTRLAGVVVIPRGAIIDGPHPVQMRRRG